MRILEKLSGCVNRKKGVTHGSDVFKDVCYCLWDDTGVELSSSLLTQSAHDQNSKQRKTHQSKRLARCSLTIGKDDSVKALHARPNERFPCAMVNLTIARSSDDGICASISSVYRLVKEGTDRI